MVIFFSEKNFYNKNFIKITRLYFYQLRLVVGNRNFESRQKFFAGRNDLVLREQEPVLPLIPQLDRPVDGDSRYSCRPISCHAAAHIYGLSSLSKSKLGSVQGFYCVIHLLSKFIMKFEVCRFRSQIEIVRVQQILSVRVDRDQRVNVVLVGFNEIRKMSDAGFGKRNRSVVSQITGIRGRPRACKRVIPVSVWVDTLASVAAFQVDSLASRFSPQPLFNAACKSMGKTVDVHHGNDVPVHDVSHVGQVRVSQYLSKSVQYGSTGDPLSGVCEPVNIYGSFAHCWIGLHFERVYFSALVSGTHLKLGHSWSERLCH